jgi:Tol biopolymer transport system component
MKPGSLLGLACGCVALAASPPPVVAFISGALPRLGSGGSAVSAHMAHRRHRPRSGALQPLPMSAEGGAEIGEGEAGDSDVRQLKARLAEALAEDDLAVAAELHVKLRELANLSMKGDGSAPVEESGSLSAAPSSSPRSVNRLLVMAERGADLLTCDMEGGDVRRGVAHAELEKLKRQGQLQQPSWSPDGTKVAASYLTLQLEEGKGGRGQPGRGVGAPGGRASGGQGQPTAAILKARIIVYEESTGKRLLSLKLPATPVFLLWHPDSVRLTCVCQGASPNDKLQLIEIDTSQDPKNENSEGRGVSAHLLDTGAPMFYAFTKNPDPKKSELVVHNGSRGGVFRYNSATEEWVTLSLNKQVTFLTPQTHRAGGNDGVVLVDGGNLVSVSADGLHRRILCPVKGYSRFAISPDEKKVVLMQQDAQTGYYSLSMLDGGAALDPLSDPKEAPVERRELPVDKVALAYFFSPDSKKLLLLTSTVPVSEIASVRLIIRGGITSQCLWKLYDLETGEVHDYGSIIPRTFFARVYLPFLDQYCQSVTPWSPDSKAFAYVTTTGGFVQRLAEAGESPPEPLKLSSKCEVASWSWC